MVLDPNFKTSFWKKHADFIYENYNISLDEAVNIFETAALSTESTCNSDSNKKQPNEPQPVGSERKNFFSSALYKPAPTNSNGIQGKIRQYLHEDVELNGVKILPYWASRQATFPKLCMMAHCYLAIPATSASSERVFSKGRRILSWQCASLKPKSVEELLCLKDWFQNFDGTL